MDHPVRNQEGRPVARARGQMPTVAVKLIDDNDRRSPEQWLEPIRDLRFAPQTPGIMRSCRMPAAAALPRSPCAKAASQTVRVLVGAEAAGHGLPRLAAGSRLRQPRLYIPGYRKRP